MNMFEVVILLLTSSMFLGILGLFYRMGRAHQFMDSKFLSIDQRFKKIDQRFEKIDQRFDKIDIQFEKIENRFNLIEKELGLLSTWVAVIESRLSDISTNVTYLMWHNQTLPHKEEIKEN